MSSTQARNKCKKALVDVSFSSLDKSGGVWTNWSDWSKCMKHWRYGCVRSKHRICKREDLSLCPGADRNGVQGKPLKCPESYCTGIVSLIAFILYRIVLNL